MVEAIKDAQPELRDLLLESFEVVDFTFTPKSVADTQFSDERDDRVHLLVLASLKGRKQSHYHLIEVFLAHDKFLVVSIRPIKSYTTPVAPNTISSSRLYLPNPALVAYVVFDQAVVVISMAKQPESPESQLRKESHLLPLTFEDVVDFHGDMNVEIVGSGMEEPHGPSHGIEDSKSHRYKAKHPSVVLLVRGGGVVRIAATSLGKLTSATAPQVTAKSKLEQAVFYGTLEKNPLSFAVRSELQFLPDEFGAAALELSLEILNSTSPKIDSIASTEMNLRQRSASLQHLAEYLKSSGVALDRATRWKLLWNAEKIEAAAAIWSRYDASLSLKPTGQKRGLLADIVESIHEDYKHNPLPEAGELDRVRTWFIKDIWNLEIALPWAYQAFKHTYQDGQNDHSALLHTISEANDVVIGALEGALHFRTTNLALYGLQDEQLEHGILKTGYEGLPEFWTSSFFIATNLRKQTELAGHLVKEFWKKSTKTGGNIDPSVLQKARLDNPSLVNLAIVSSTERIRWLSAQNSPELQMDAEQLQMLQTSSEDEQITLLATDLDLGDDAITIAERHQIMPTLAAVIMIEANKCANMMHRAGIESDEFDYAAARENQLETRVSHYFDKFGTSWATALYEYDLASGGLFNLLNTYQDRQVFLTAFLRSKPEYAKIAWIQEVTREQNFDRAAQTLLDLGLKREQDLWSKKIELSLGKLARMAGRKYSQANGILIPDGGQTELVTTGEQLGLIQIQDRIYQHVFPSIEAAIDDKAEVQLALESHGNKSLKPQRAFSAFLEENMGYLVRHESMDAFSLIDLLTLMNGGGQTSQDHTEFRSQQFYLALQACRYGVSGKEEQKLIQRVIWRRCMLRDNWEVVNDTESKDDQEVNDQLRDTALYLTFRACFKNRKSAKCRLLNITNGIRDL
jgi:nuclear pore complex protein Nup133